MELKFDVHAKISRPIASVFDAVTDPQKLTFYFTTGGASGPLEQGATVRWSFADFPGEFPVRVTKLVTNFEALDPGTTLVKISESGWREHKINLRSGFF